MQEEKEILVTLFEMKDFARTVEYVISNTGINLNANLEENYTNVASEQYIQDGLQLHFDAINNTGTGHSNTTETWRDLSNNHNDGLLTDVTWDGNSAIFNGTSSWANCGEQNNDCQTLIVTFSANAINTGANNTCIIGNWDNRWRRNIYKSFKENIW